MTVKRSQQGYSNFKPGAIASALVGHPKMILADGPTAALDSKSGHDVVELMRKLAREQGSTILIVIIQLEDGRLCPATVD